MCVCYLADPVIHVWGLYPHTDEVFSLLMSFSLPGAPSLMVATKDRLCVASNNPNISNFSIDMYSITDQSESMKTKMIEKLSHFIFFLSMYTCTASFSCQSENSHTDVITALDASPKLKLFASCSLDSTVRIWTENNHPVRYTHVTLLYSSYILHFHCNNRIFGHLL